MRGLMKRILCCVLLFFTCASQGLAAGQSSSSSSGGARFQIGLRLGAVRFSGERMFKKYCEEFLNKKNVLGTALWPKGIFYFNPENSSGPIFAMGIGLVNFRGSESKSYQGGKVKVDVLGSYFEHGFIVGFHPGVNFLKLSLEAGTGIPLMEDVTISTPLKKKKLNDAQRLVVTQLSLALKANILLGLFAEGVLSTGVGATDDYMMTVGGGYAF